MSTSREAHRDASEYARAKMFYGEGAGTRRKLIEAKVQTKAQKSPTYARVFHEALARQDMATHAKKAQNERKRIDRAAAVSRNIKGILSGNSKSLNTSLLVIGTAVYIARRKGYDQKAINKAKKLYADHKTRRRNNKVYVIYSDLKDPY